MKKISEILKYASCFALSLMLMTSCDKEADKLKIETETLSYSGTFYMYMHSTDMLSSEEELFNIDIDTVPGNITIDASSEGYSVVKFVPGREIRLTTSFLQEKEGHTHKVPMGIYMESPVTRLYNAVIEDANVTDEEKSKLEEILSEIKDTMTIAPFTTSRVPLIQQGAAIVTYDFEQNSFYSSYTLGEVAYSHKSNISTAIKYVSENLLSKMASKTIAETAIQKIRSIASSTTGKMSDTWGRLSFQYMNSYCDYEMQIKSEEERPNEMLINISKVLYGEDENGKPYKDLWLVIDYIGHMGDSSFDWEERREE